MVWYTIWIVVGKLNSRYKPIKTNSIEFKDWQQQTWNDQIAPKAISNLPQMTGVILVSSTNITI